MLGLSLLATAEFINSRLVAARDPSFALINAEPSSDLERGPPLSALWALLNLLWGWNLEWGAVRAGELF